jgi:GntR family transcriptional regulator, transcriptional repressor for pyruvate dehydrogenase complex
MSEQPMTPFGLLQKEALPDQVINLILDLIQQQQLKPGDKLPPERELAASMGIARQTLRSALSALAAIDVLEIRQGAGAFITDLKPDKLIDRLKFFISLNESSVHEFFEARTSIELTVVALAATRATDEQLATLAASPALQFPQDGFVNFIHHDLDFHAQIAAVAQNSILAEFLDIFRAIRGNIRRATTLTTADIDRAIREHRQIVDALAAHDPERAQVAMRQHMESSEIALRHLMQRGQL